MLLGNARWLASLNAVMVALSFAPVLAQDPVIATDAHGREIGQVLHMDSSGEKMQVAVLENGEPIAVLVRRESFSHRSRPVVFFENADCSGPAYMLANTEVLGFPIAVAGPNGTLYLGDETTEASHFLSSAMWGSKCVAYQAVLPVIDAYALRDLELEYTAPYEIASPGSGGGSGRGKDE